MAVVFAGGKLSSGPSRSATRAGGVTDCCGARPHAEDSAIRISLDALSGRHSALLASGRRDVVTLDIPVRLEGAPADLNLVQNGMSVSIAGNERRTWRTEARPDGGFHGCGGWDKPG